MFADGSGWELESGGSPLCESCSSEPAVVHLVQIQDGAIAHTHLCQRCAQQAAEHGPATMAVVFAMPAMLSGLFGNVLKPEDAERRAGPPSLDDPVCGVCGTTLDQVTESGEARLRGCYDVFSSQVDQALATADDPPVYQGKLPHRLPEDVQGQREILRLRRMLEELVECERFEEAAGVRDRLAELGEPSGLGAGSRDRRPIVATRCRRARNDGGAAASRTPRDSPATTPSCTLRIASGTRWRRAFGRWEMLGRSTTWRGALAARRG